MMRILTGAAFAALLLGSASAFAGTATTTTSTPSASTTTPAHTTAAVDYGARCTSLAGQWKTAEGANATNTHLSKAKAMAAKGEKMCGSKTATDHPKGVSKYEAALKLLGVTPT